MPMEIKLKWRNAFVLFFSQRFYLNLKNSMVQLQAFGNHLLEKLIISTKNKTGLQSSTEK